jgi:uncharacterized peroxidase-related enzyme
MSSLEKVADLKLDNLTEETAVGKSKEILALAKKQNGFVPNMYAKMAHNPATLDAYTYAYDTFRANSGFNPVEQEVILLTIARENGCEYCMAAHSFIADKMSKVPETITNAIRDNTIIEDTKLAALSKLTIALVVKRGNVTQKEVDTFLASGYTKSHVLGILAGISAKIISNYANHINHPELDAPFAGRAWSL